MAVADWGPRPVHGFLQLDSAAEGNAVVWSSHQHATECHYGVPETGVPPHSPDSLLCFCILYALCQESEYSNRTLTVLNYDTSYAEFRLCSFMQ